MEKKGIYCPFSSRKEVPTLPEIKANETSKALQMELDNELDILIDDIFVLSQELIVQNGTSDTGALLISGKVEKNFLQKRIVYDAPHAVPIEFGTDPHYVSKEGIMGIKKWAQRKLGLSEKKAERAAYAIANNILKKGTDPQPYLRPAAEVITGKAVTVSG